MDGPRSFQEDMAMSKRTLLAALAALALGGSAAGTLHAYARATDLDRMTYVRFPHPIALPGVQLGPGTYVFELPDPIGAFDVVRVSSQDRRTIYLTAFTRVVERPAAIAAGQVVSFGEANPRDPHPITVWWPTGESTGRAFIY
jgi:hypothetical protein